MLGEAQAAGAELREKTMCVEAQSVWTRRTVTPVAALHILAAKSAYSCGDGAEANTTLRHIISHACCLEDKLESYLHLIVTLFDTLQVKESFTMTSDVLSQLGEVIPDVIGDKEAKQISETTSSMLSYAAKENFLASMSSYASKETFLPITIASKKLPATPVYLKS
jgi:hypothetical protein